MAGRAVLIVSVIPFSTSNSAPSTSILTKLGGAILFWAIKSSMETRSTVTSPAKSGGASAVARACPPEYFASNSCPSPDV